MATPGKKKQNGVKKLEHVTAHTHTGSPHTASCGHAYSLDLNSIKAVTNADCSEHVFILDHSAEFPN